MSETLSYPPVANQFVQLEMRPNGILYALYLKNTTIDLKDAQDIVEMRLSFTQNNVVPVLIRIEGFSKITRAARKYIYSSDAVVGLKAAALLRDSAFASVIANLFTSINNPLKIPVRAFNQ
jgi:hypothetical protein